LAYNEPEKANPKDFDIDIEDTVSDDDFQYGETPKHGGRASRDGTWAIALSDSEEEVSD
jgi:hypothetical protein